jgi:predicted membrane channel-forming protein YqfA (hemolysin III family)
MSKSTEKAIMLLVTGITNIAIFPALYLAFHKQLYFQFYMASFTFACSFLYHSLDSLDIPQLYLTRTQWHRLDNIGTIECFIMLAVYFMDTLEKKSDHYVSKMTTKIDLFLNSCGLFIVMVMQEDKPWDIENTFYPILLFTIVLAVKVVFVRKPRINLYYLSRGALILTSAVVFFVRGLDDNNDYLRINHGMWHCLVSISSFYLWQSVDKDRADPVVKNLALKQQPRFEFGRTLKTILAGKFFEAYKEKLPHFA